MKIPGYTVLSWLLPRHAHVADLYFLYMAALLGQPIKSPPRAAKLDLDAIWTYIFGVPASQSVVPVVQKTDLSMDAVVVILGMVRATLNTNVSGECIGRFSGTFLLCVFHVVGIRGGVIAYFFMYFSCTYLVLFM